MNKMHAVFMQKTGESRVLNYETCDMPEVTSIYGVKVKIHAAGVNPIDTKIRRFMPFYPKTERTILGCDFAGEVVDIASHVSKFKVGDKVWGCHGGLGKEAGKYAEYAVIEQQDFLAHMPRCIDFIEAAAAPLVLITAWGALFDRGRLQAGETVLIHAGAGGVGHVAIQLAKNKGARVITTVSTQEKAAFVKSLGADDVIFYPQEKVVERVLQLTQEKGADLVLDTVGGDVFRDSISMAAYSGRLVTLLAADGIDLTEARMRNLSIAFELMLTPMLRDLAEQRAKQIDVLNQCGLLMDQFKLNVHVDTVLTLQETAQAHDLIERGSIKGKIVLTV